MTVINAGGRRIIDVFAALLALAAFVLSMIVILTQQDGAAWFAPLVVAIPAVVAFLPLVLPQPLRRAARIAAMVALLAVYVVAGLSVGIYFLPSLVLMVVSVARRA